MQHSASTNGDERASDATNDRSAEILVVDDDDRNARAINVVLRDLNVRPTFASSGDEALRQLLERDFAVILLDVRMPGMDGFETARFIRMRDRSRHVPIIFMTAFGHEDTDIRRAYELGAVDYLFKPIIPEILRAKIQVFVELRNQSAELAEKAEQLRAVERLEGLRRLEEERRKWEAEVLRRQIEEQRGLNERLAEVDRRKDEFIALLAHELRNPLTPIAMGLELRLEILDIGEIVEAAVDTCRVAIDQMQHEIDVSGPRHVIALRVDPVRMTQVVANLLNNAVRYSDPGGHIAVRWGVEGERAFVSVTDRGRGIAPEFITKIFDSFAQERDGGRGLGLGLTLVRELVDLHGGAVEARSEGRGKGSEFIVRLPLAEQPVAARERTPRPRRPPASRALRVVVVEDDADIREALCALVHMWGHQVAGVTGDGLSGVQLLLETKPDVGLIDVGLPGLSGYGVAERIRSTLGSEAPRLVAMTGFGQQSDVQRALEAGFDVHLVKPSSPDELRSAVEGAR